MKILIELDDINALALLDEVQEALPDVDVTGITNMGEGYETYLHTAHDVTPDDLTILKAVIQNHNAEIGFGEVLLVEQLAIARYAESELLKQPFNMFDFKRHLKPPLSFNKVVTRSEDGRPLEANYYIDTELLCRVQFVFRNQPGSTLMHKRAEVLNYIKKDGTWTPDILIKKKVYDMSNSNDLYDVIGEREDSRAYLMRYMSGAITGAMMANRPTWTVEDVARAVQPFMRNFALEIDDFKAIGTSDLRDHVALASTLEDYPWMSDEVAAGVTLQMFIVSTLTYTTEDTFPNKQVNW